MKRAQAPDGWIVLSRGTRRGHRWNWEPMGETPVAGSIGADGHDVPKGESCLMRRSWCTVYPTRQAAEDAVRHVGEIGSKYGLDWHHGVEFRLLAVSPPGHELRRSYSTIWSSPS